MPDITLALLLIIGGSIALGVIIGWVLHTARAESEKIAINTEWQEQLQALRQAEQRVNRQRKELSAQLAETRAELATTRQGAGNGDDRLQESLAALRTELAESNNRRERLRRDLERFIERSKAFVAASREKDEKIFALSRELETWQQRLPPLLERYRDKQHENTVIIEELAAERQKSAELAQNLQTLVMPNAPRNIEAADSSPHEAGSNARQPSDGNGRDDLKRIKGVGPTLEKLLNSLGIYRFAQIAAFDNDDVARISAKLQQFPGRIHRDRWVQQARDLLR